MAKKKTITVVKKTPPKAVPSGTDAKSGFVPKNPENQSTKRKGKRNT
jgi:hypothetical protein